jgi:hypothetical protein
MSIMKTIVISLLICSLIAFASADHRPTQGAQSIQLDVFSGSNSWMIAVAVRNAGVDTRSVQIQEARSSSWQSLTYQSGWGYFTISSNDRLKFPVSVRLTSVNGAQVTINNAISSPSVGSVNTGVTYSGTTPSDPTSAPTTPSKATQAPTTRPNAPTSKPGTTAPTAKATAAPATKASTTAPTSKSSTKAPTAKAATTAPTAKAATKAPTSKAATSAPSTGCSSPIKLMVPLYTYPGATWDTVAAGAKTVKTVAIINPNSGPGNGPDSSYNTYMNKLNAAGVDMIGYVHTSYGARSIADVKADIDVYASQFPLLKGIFLDEAGATASVLSYYQQLYNYIMGMPGWKYDVINPGAVPTSGYSSAATQIVSFEDVSSKFSASANPSGASCSNKDLYAVITYGASSSGMQSAIATARSKGYYGWVYVTDGSGASTYNTLASYYPSMVSYIASTN